MEHIPVDSSQIASIAFDPAAGSMQVLFRRGGLYQYENVSPEEFEACLSPSEEDKFSVGTAFGRIIKAVKVCDRIEGAKPKPPTPTAPVPDAPAAATAPTSADPVALPAEVQEVSRESNSLAAEASQIVVRDEVQQSRASEVLLAIAGMRRQISETFKPMKDAAHKAHRVICDQEKLVDGPLAEAERAVKAKIGDFVQEQRRLAREADEAARAKARQQAEEEAKTAAAEAALNQAIQLEQDGRHEAAAAVLAAPAPVPVVYVAPAPVAPAVASVDGVTIRTEWDFRIVNRGLVPREYMVVNETAIRSVVKATKGKVAIPGVEAFEKPVVASRRA